MFFQPLSLILTGWRGYLLDHRGGWHSHQQGNLVGSRAGFWLARVDVQLVQFRQATLLLCSLFERGGSLWMFGFGSTQETVWGRQYHQWWSGQLSNSFYLTARQRGWRQRQARLRRQLSRYRTRGGSRVFRKKLLTRFGRRSQRLSSLDPSRLARWWWSLRVRTRFLSHLYRLYYSTSKRFGRKRSRGRYHNRGFRAARSWSTRWMSTARPFTAAPNLRHWIRRLARHHRQGLLVPTELDLNRVGLAGRPKTVRRTVLGRPANPTRFKSRLALAQTFKFQPYRLSFSRSVFFSTLNYLGGRPAYQRRRRRRNQVHPDRPFRSRSTHQRWPALLFPSGVVAGGLSLRDTSFLTEINSAGVPFVWFCDARHSPFFSCWPVLWNIHKASHQGIPWWANEVWTRVGLSSLLRVVWQRIV